MVQKCSNTHSLTFGESIPFAPLKKNASEIVDDLFFMIQRILVGTVAISNHIINDKHLEVKIYLSANSPVVILQYPLDSNQNTELKHDAEVEYNTLELPCDNVKRNSSPTSNVKQEIPELLAVLKDSEENGEIQEKLCEDWQENETGIFIPLMHSEMGTGKSVRRELNEMLPDLGNFQTRNANWALNTTPLNEINLKNRNTISHEENHSKLEDACISSLYRHIHTEKQNHQYLQISRSEERRRYSCAFCGKMFHTKKSYHQHEWIHTGIKPYPCSFCGKRFTTRHGKDNHERIHTGTKPYSCRYCGKTFTQSSNLTAHQRIHTGEKPFSCTICSKSFVTSTHLIRHQKIHSGEKPFSCKHCDKTFISSCHLFRHQQIHTNEDSGEAFSHIHTHKTYT